MSKTFRGIPRILKINNIAPKKLCVSVLFSNGDNRLLDFNRIFKEEWGVQKGDPEYTLFSPKEFGKVELENDTLTWHNIELYISTAKGSKIKVPFDVGADVLYKLSIKDSERSFSIGTLLRKARLAAKMTQEELAEKAGTSRTYITKLENDTQDIEVGTLKRIVEAGLHKHLKISIE